MRRYAFIDVQNTESTTNQLLGFVIDWYKMYVYLKEKWGCEKVFFYSGIANGDNETTLEYQKLSKLGYVIRAKPYFIYKNPDQIINIICPKCKTEILHKVSKGTKWKSNCDVEFSVDAMNNMEKGAEFLFFTGDGDFEYLARNAVEKGVKIYIISSAKKVQVAPRYSVSRFSTKLRELIAEKKDSVFYVDIALWRLKIKKEV